MEHTADPLTDVSLIIKTFERPDCLERLLASIRKHDYDRCPVLVADDSRSPFRSRILDAFSDVVDEYVVLPHKSGVSAGRNELLRRVQTDYFVIHDDDFVYGEETDIGAAHRQLIASDLDLLGGYLFEKEKEYATSFLPRRVQEAIAWYENTWTVSARAAKLVEADGGVAIRPLPRQGHAPYRCDFTLNFFIARTRLIRDVVGGWHPDLSPTGEHWEFFYRCKKAGLNVAFSDAFGVYHLPEQSARYEDARYGEEKQMIEISLAEHGLDYLDRGDDVFVRS
ncbi:MAG: glycosyltransferase [Bacteroidetes bacterium]|jgi:glycosyltransferase involved in cell wall biosynthesis|nr:glycosyltransferase [Bacteroidota bacterium]